MDYYKTLGVQRSASIDQIKKAYKSLAKKYHPDVNKDAGATELFLAVTEAYEILSDPAEKMRYDGGIYSRRTRPRPEPPKPPPEPPKKEPHNEPSADQVDCSFFGGSGTGRNILRTIKLTPEQMRFGGPHWTWIKKRDLCGKCVGDGTNMVGVLCKECNGTGFKKDMVVETIHFKISPGIQPGHVINVLGVGETAPGKPPGNVRIVVI